MNLESIDRSNPKGFIIYWKQRPFHFEEVFKISSTRIEELADKILNEEIFKDIKFTNIDDEYYSDLKGEL